MAAVFACWVHTSLRQQTRPSEGHESPEFAVAVFVVVVDVMRGMFH